MYTPIICELPDSSERAACDGRNSSSSIALRTFSKVACDTEPLPLITRDAVPSPTPARRATSLMVATASLIRSVGGKHTPSRPAVTSAPARSVAQRGGDALLRLLHRHAGVPERRQHVLQRAVLVRRQVDLDHA